jgi:hypothetical protein
MIVIAILCTMFNNEVTSGLEQLICLAFMQASVHALRAPAKNGISVFSSKHVRDDHISQVHGYVSSRDLLRRLLPYLHAACKLSKSFDGG